MNPADLDERLSRLALVGFDVDGVFTDGRFYLTDDGVETKAFHTQDGFGIRRLVDAGITVAVISGRRSGAVERRMAELGVQHVHLGCQNKEAQFQDLLQTTGVSQALSAYVGDDVPDLGVLRAAGVAIAVANAVAEVRGACHWTTAASGGHGAVREVCDRILRRQADRAARP